MNKPAIGLRESKENDTAKIIHPKQCQKCGGRILGWGTVIGSGWINLDDMTVDECGDAEDFEIYDEDCLEYVCQEDECGFSWEL